MGQGVTSATRNTRIRHSWTMRTALPEPTPGARRWPCALCRLALAAPAAAADGARAPAPTPATTETADHRRRSTGPPPSPPRAEVGTVVGRLPGTRRKAVRERGHRGPRPLVGGGVRRRRLPPHRLRPLPRLHPRRDPPRDVRPRPDVQRRHRRAVVVGHPADAQGPARPAGRRQAGAVGDRALRPADARRPDRRDASPPRCRCAAALFLTRQPAGWRVFGYDVSKGWL